MKHRNRRLNPLGLGRLRSEEEQEFHAESAIDEGKHKMQALNKIREQQEGMVWRQ